MAYDISPVAGGFLIGGGILFLLGIGANRYHSRAFDRHTDRLNRYARQDDTASIHAEVERFHKDRWIDVATWFLMMEPVGFIMFGIGVGLTIL